MHGSLDNYLEYISIYTYYLLIQVNVFDKSEMIVINF